MLPNIYIPQLMEQRIIEFFIKTFCIPLLWWVILKSFSVAWNNERYCGSLLELLILILDYAVVLWFRYFILLPHSSTIHFQKDLNVVSHVTLTCLAVTQENVKDMYYIYIYNFNMLCLRRIILVDGAEGREDLQFVLLNIGLGLNLNYMCAI